MDKLVIKEAELAQVVQLANAAEKQIREALINAKKLSRVSSGESQTWSGESKNSYVMYLDILVKYHEDLAESVEMFEEAVKELQKNSDTFTSADMSGIRGI